MKVLARHTSKIQTMHEACKWSAHPCGKHWFVQVTAWLPCLQAMTPALWTQLLVSKICWASTQVNRVSGRCVSEMVFRSPLLVKDVTGEGSRAVGE
jgi:hypothetical protein